MDLKIKKIILAWLLSVFLVFSAVAGAYAYSDILAFGDSLSDDGNADGFGIKRFSNGPVWVEYLASEIGKNLTLDMAIGGATSGWDNPAVSKSTGNTAFDFTGGLLWQVDTYGAIHADSPTSIGANTLVTITAGGNDMFNYFAPNTAQAAANRALGFYNPATAADNISLAIQEAISLGGSSFLVMNLSTNQQPWYISDWMKAFNAALSQELAELRSNPLYSDDHFYLLNVDGYVPTGIDNFAGTWLANSCASPVHGAVCTNETFAWWDTVGVHPTTEVHAQIGALAANSIPEPATMLLLGLSLAMLAGVRRKIK